MKNFFSRKTVLCAVCGTGRDLPELELPRVKMFGASLLWTVLTGAIAGLVSGILIAAWVGVLSGVLCFLILEVYYSAKFKRELVCPVCHFDPILYRRSPELAKERCLHSLKMREEVFLAKWQALKKTTAPKGSRL
jgi:hypothetical protein